MEVEICQFFEFDLPHTTFYDHVTEFLVIGCLLEQDSINLKKLFEEDHSVYENREELFSMMSYEMKRKVERKLRENSIDVMETILEFYDTDPSSQREAAYLIIVTARELCYVERAHCMELMNKFNIFIHDENRFLNAKEKILTHFEDSISEVFSVEVMEREEKEGFETKQKSYDVLKEQFFEQDEMKTNSRFTVSYESSCSENGEINPRSTYYSPIESGFEFNNFGSSNRIQNEMMSQRLSEKKSRRRFSEEEEEKEMEVPYQSQSHPNVPRVQLNFDLGQESKQSQKKLVKKNSNTKSTIKILPRDDLLRSAIKKRASVILSSYGKISKTQIGETLKFRASTSPKFQNHLEEILKTARPVVDYSWKVEPKDPLAKKSISREPMKYIKKVKKNTKKLAKSYAFDKISFSHKKNKIKSKKGNLDSSLITSIVKKTLRSDKKPWPLRKLETFQASSKKGDNSSILKTFEYMPYGKSQASSSNDFKKRRRITMSPAMTGVLEESFRKNTNKFTLTETKLKKFGEKKKINTRQGSLGSTSKMSSLSMFDSVALQRMKKMKKVENKKPSYKFKLKSIKSKLSYMSPEKVNITSEIPKSTRISSIKSSKLWYKNSGSAFTERGAKTRVNSNYKSQKSQKQNRMQQVKKIKKILDGSTGFKKLKMSLLNSKKNHYSKKKDQMKNGKSGLSKEPKKLMKMASSKRMMREETSFSKIKNSKIMSLLRKKRSRDILKQFDRNNTSKTRKSMALRGSGNNHPLNLRNNREQKKKSSKTEIGLLSSRFKGTSYFDSSKQNYVRGQLTTRLRGGENSESKHKENFETEEDRRNGGITSRGIGSFKKQDYLKKIYGLRHQGFEREVSDFEMYR